MRDIAVDKGEFTVIGKKAPQLIRFPIINRPAVRGYQVKYFVAWCHMVKPLFAYGAAEAAFQSTSQSKVGLSARRPLISSPGPPSMT